MKLKDKVALITGGNKGIGLAVAQRYAEEGATSVIVSRNLASSQAAADGIVAAGGKALALQCDVGKIEQIQPMVDAAVRAAGGIDILFNNAGVVDLRPLTEVREKDWDYVVDINLKGAFFVLQAVAREMIKQGRGGKIINISSQAGRRGEPFTLVYGATKAAMIHMNQTAGLELIKHRIRVNGISPGVIATDMWETVDEQFGRCHGLPKGEVKRMAGEKVPYGRFGKVEDLLGPAVFLACDDSDYMVAQTLNVDGGNWMS